MLGTGGIIPPPRGYFAAIQPVLERYDILLIADEVITGFGRTGRMFGSRPLWDRAGPRHPRQGPDQRLCALLRLVVGERVWEVLTQASDTLGAFSHGYTYSGHPLGAAAANAVLDIVEAEDLPGNADARRRLFPGSRLRDAFADHPLVGEVRGVGLMAAVEFVETREPRRFFDPASRSAPGWRPPAWRRASSPAPCRMATSSASRHRSSPREADVDEIVDRATRGMLKVLDSLFREGVKLA